MATERHCRYHCRACGRHFTSLDAFDAHRVGPTEDRRCITPTALAAVTGTCRIAGTADEVGVIVHVIPIDADKRDRIARLRSGRGAMTGEAA